MGPLFARLALDDGARGFDAGKKSRGFGGVSGVFRRRSDAAVSLSHVNFEAPTFGKTQLAIFADEVFSLVVDGRHVVFEMMLTTESATALDALVLFQLFMNDFGVTREMGFVSERFATQRASKGAQFEVNRVHVLLQGSLQSATKIARRTRIGFLIPF